MNTKTIIILAIIALAVWYFFIRKKSAPTVGAVAGAPAGALAGTSSDPGSSLPSVVSIPADVSLPSAISAQATPLPAVVDPTQYVSSSSGQSDAELQGQSGEMTAMIPLPTIQTLNATTPAMIQPALRTNLGYSLIGERPVNIV